MNPRTAALSFLIAAGGMLLVAGLARGSNNTAEAILRRPECTLGSCPLMIGPADAGRTFNYSPGSRFTLLTNGHKAPEVICSAEGAVAPLAFEEKVAKNGAPPSPAMRFEAKKTGTCSIATANFQVTVNIAKFR
jgi:hypothetical protein